MKRLLLFSAVLVFAHIGAQAQVVQENDITVLAPDLAFGKITKMTISAVEIVVLNKGKLKSPVAVGGFHCESVNPTNGVKLGFSSLIAIKELDPRRSFRVNMDCGAGNKITAARLDGANKVKESNEKNNLITF